MTSIILNAIKLIIIFLLNLKLQKSRLQMSVTPSHQPRRPDASCSRSWTPPLWVWLVSSILLLRISEGRGQSDWKLLEFSQFCRLRNTLMDKLWLSKRARSCLRSHPGWSSRPLAVSSYQAASTSFDHLWPIWSIRPHLSSAVSSRS